MTRTIDLPEDVYTTVRDVAEASGMTPADWIAAHLPSQAASAENGHGGHTLPLAPLLTSSQAETE
jgi:hypothetical protein